MTQAHMKTSLFVFLICSLFFQNAFSQQSTLVFSKRYSASLSGNSSTSNFTTSAQGNTQIDGYLRVSAGLGYDTKPLDCNSSSAPKPKLLCLIKNEAIVELIIKVLYPESIKVTLNGKVIVAPSQMPQGQGFLEIPVKLKASNSLQTTIKGLFSSSASISFYAKANSQPNQSPLANFSFDPQTGTAPLMVQFNAMMSSDPDGTIAEYLWNFSDGQTANGVIVSKQYQIPGTYQVTLTVKDQFGATGSKTLPIIITQNQLPLANFVESKETDYGVLKINLDASSSLDNDGTLTEYLWNFGDGQTASGKIVSHIYQTPGQYQIQLQVKDDKSGTATITKTVNVSDQRAALISILKPLANAVIQNSPFLIEGTSDEPLSEVRVSLNGETEFFADIQANRISFSKSISTTTLGQRTLKISAKDRYGNPTEKIVSFFYDEPAPPIAHLTIKSTPSGVAPLLVLFDSTNTSDPRNQNLIFEWNFGDGKFSSQSGIVTHLFENPGNYTVTLKVTNTSGLSDSKSVQVNISPLELPPKPEEIAPPIVGYKNTSFENKVSFLYEGSDPIQKDLQQNALVQDRIVILRGQVLNSDLTPASGVKISINGKTEFGYTYTREDGFYDLATNGGGEIQITYDKVNHLPVQRKIETKYQDYYRLDQVVLVQLDSKATRMTNLSSISQLIESSVVTDQDGTREIKMIVPKETKALVELPQGGTLELPTLNLRLTEYTVGENGPQKMPAILPVTSGYTFAFDLTSDEALALGSKHIQFSKYVSYYVDNFLGFPIGMIMPIGSYDYDRGIWIPEENGRVIKVLNITNDIAQLDINGSNTIASSAELSVLGIDNEELQIIANKYAVGKSFWRGRTKRFSPHDTNVFTAGRAKPPAQPRPKTQGEPAEAQQSCAGSIVDLASQTLREMVSCIGIKPSLTYSSSRVSGKKMDRTIPIQLSSAAIDSGVQKIELRIEVAGQVFEQIFAAAPNLNYTYTWDGKDQYGREVNETVLARVKITYRFEQNYFAPLFSDIPTFGAFFSGLSDTFVKARDLGITETTYEVSLGYPTRFSLAEGGWRFENHHAYDVNSKTIYFGDGTSDGNLDLDAQNTNVISIFAGTGQAGYDGNNQIATSTRLNGPNYLYYASDRSIYFVDRNNFRIRKILPTGTIVNVAGNGTNGTGGDGGLATEAQIFAVSLFSMTEGTDNSIYFCDGNKIRKIDKNGIITTFAGGNSPGYAGDGGPAIDARFNNIEMIDYKDGSIYISDAGNARIREIMPNGIVRTIVGTGILGRPTVGQNALQANLRWPVGIGFLNSGEFIFSDRDNHQIYKVNQFGQIEIFAGSGNRGNAGEGNLAVSANINSPTRLQILSDNSVFFNDKGNSQYKIIGSDGNIRLFAGNGISNVAASLGVNALTSSFLDARGHVLSPEGIFYVSEFGANRILKITSPFEVLRDSSNNIVIPSKQGDEVYVFDRQGRHLQTLFGLTGKVKWQFQYDNEDRLIAMSDEFNQITQLIRNSEGRLSKVISPYGQETQIEFIGSYLSKIVKPNGDYNEMKYSSDGLMTEFRNPNGAISKFNYLSDGSLARDTNALSGGLLLERLALGSDSAEIRATSAEGKTSRIQTAGSYASKATFNLSSSGYVTSTSYNGYGTTTSTSTDTTESSTTSVDSRFRSNAVYLNQYSQRHGNLTQTTSQSRSYPTLNNFFDFEMNEIQSLNSNLYLRNYNSSNKTQILTSPEGRISRSTINDQQQPISVQNGTYVPTSINYDQQGRLIASVTADRTTSMTYGNHGLVETITDPLGRVKSFEYDSNLRLTKETLYDGRSVQYRYDQNNNLIGITPPGRSEHVSLRNAIDLLVSYLPPALSGVQTETVYEYTKDKEIKKTTRPDGKTIDYTYDAATRNLFQITTASGAYQFRYFTNSLLQRSSSPDNVIMNYSYNGELPISIATSGFVNSNLEFTYDNFFRPNQIKVNGSGIGLSYDKDGLLMQVGSQSMIYNENSALINLNLAQAQTIQGYNQFGELISSQSKVNTSILHEMSMQRDKVSRLTSKSESYVGESNNFEYTYDTSGRLTQVKANGLVYSNYTYDLNGNRLSKTIQGNTTPSSYDEQDRLVQSGSKSYSYNLNGDLEFVSDSSTGITRNYQYDEFGNLKQAAIPGKNIQYLTDANMRRVGRVVNGTFNQGYVYQSQYQVAAELASDQSVKSRFIYGSKINVPDYMIKSGITYRLISDQVGSIKLVVDANTGAIAQAMTYDEFGNVLSDSNPGFQPFAFAGCLYDNDTKLCRFGARDYDPETGRWTSKDPIRFKAGDTNLYGYVMNDPINLIDPNGLWGLQIGVGGSIAAFLFGGAAEAGVAITYSSEQGLQVGTYTSTQARAGIGGGAGVGVNVTITPAAKQISDLNGPSVSFGAEALVASGSVNISEINNQPATSISFGLGPGLELFPFVGAGYTSATRRSLSGGACP